VDTLSYKSCCLYAQVESCDTHPFGWTLAVLMYAMIARKKDDTKMHESLQGIGFPNEQNQYKTENVALSAEHSTVLMSGGQYPSLP
jgi:hypothetical protein